MSGLDPATQHELRLLVSEVLAEVLPGPSARANPGAHPPPGPALPPVPPTQSLAAGGVPSGVPAATASSPPPPPPGPIPGPRAGGPPGAASSRAEPGCWEVSIASDDDLRDFALRVLRLADNPKHRRDLIAGRIRFRLAGGAQGAMASRPAHRVERGAVTERAVAAAAAAGSRLVLGPRAVLTPLARDKARTLGVPVEKER